MKSIAVVGASLAGLSTARALRAQGFDGELTLIGDELHRPYDRPPLSKEFLAGTIDEEHLTLATAGDELGIEFRLGVRATALQPGWIDLSDGEVVRVDGVVLATGATARRWPGDDLRGVHVLRTLDDARALRADLVPEARLVVVGAGFVGAEVAATARGLGLAVTVVEAAPAPLAVQLGESMGAVVAALHTDHGTDLICGVGVRALQSTDAGSGPRVTGVELADGRVLPADVVVVGIGARPATDWLTGSGVTVDAGGVVCDETGATSVDGVVAVGDCSTWFDPRSGRPHRVEHWTAALERSAIAAATLLGRPAPVLRSGGIPYFWSDQYGTKIQFAGHVQPGDDVEIVSGSTDSRRLVAIYRRDGRQVAVLGLSEPGLFTRHRRQLAAPALPAETSLEGART
jgi:NADPH-dependent 2,4-dienoyl-CoA reductase/sulfur reductase-like enzyme